MRLDINLLCNFVHNHEEFNTFLQYIYQFMQHMNKALSYVF